MKSLSIRDIVNAVSGELLCGNENQLISSIVTDSKKVINNSLFVPIKGEKVDAHKFINDAFKLGAKATFTQYKNLASNSGTYILVEDSKKALQKLASFYRDKFNVPVIGITGSVGKTTTKEMVACALSYGGKVMKTKGNQNSQIGLPLTLFRLEDDDDFAVVEMGMSEFGEMQRLAKVAKVNRAIITNIGISHIENLKTQENIRNEKLHIIDCFNKNDTLFLNGNDPLLHALEGALDVKTVFFGTEEFCDYRAVNITSTETSTEFTLVSEKYNTKVSIPTIGMHNVFNALASIAVAVDVGLDIDTILEGLNTFKQPDMRQQINRTGYITLIDDSYNASPDSIKSGINVLKTIQKNNRSIAVIGDMLELGEHSYHAHSALGEYLAEKNIDIVVTIGNESKAIVDGVKSKSQNIIAKSFNSNCEAIDYLDQIIKKNDTLIVKGSRGMHTDEIVNYLLENY